MAAQSTHGGSAAEASPRSAPTKSLAAAKGRGAISAVWFAATTLLGAFLVFQVQPVISKCVLPWFGGTPAVWTTCMLFFQLLLFAGYLYAHVLRSRLNPRAQAAIHLALLAAAALTLPIEPNATWKPTGSESPVVHLLILLTAHVGLPYFVLSSTGPLVQAWLSYRDCSDRVYRLYALSNIGSLGALLSYPFLVEPVLSVSSQSVVWSLMFCLFVLVQGVVAIGLLRIRGPAATPRPNPTTGVVPAPPAWVRFLWLALPALASTMLLVVTNHVCQDVAVIPFLWVLPLSLYLASFIICFDSPERYRPKLTAAITLAALAAIQAQPLLPASLRLVAEAGFYMVMLMGVCLLCHGEVARLKPHPSRLTQFYAFVSAGGATGGILVAVVCPLLWDHFAELPITLAVVAVFAFVLLVVCQGWSRSTYDWSAARRLRFGMAALVIAPGIAVALASGDETIASERNFFGVLRVTRNREGVRLVHGTTIHGIQRYGDAAGEPTSYYGRRSGVGQAIAALHARSPSLRIGIVGLGCGVLATYGRESDEFDMIEINPAVVEIARKHFTFLSSSRSEIRHHLGDGRLVLERMRDARFDLLVLDAFSSDAIPAHLLTREAMTLYQQRLARDGVIAIHVSNNHLDLVPLAHRLAADRGLASGAVHSPGDRSIATKPAKWVLIARPANSLWSDERLSGISRPSPTALREAPLWTDQHHNLASVLKLW